MSNFRLAVRGLALLTAVGLAAACGDNGSDDPESPGDAADFVDQGSIPVAATHAPFQSAASAPGGLLVATDDGLWRHELATKRWSRSGLRGETVRTIYRHPTITGLYFAAVYRLESATEPTLYRSRDGGASWEGVEGLVVDPNTNTFENYSCFAARPAAPAQVYANLEGGTMIAVSLDTGRTWRRINDAPESYFGYDCNIEFAPGNPDVLYQGAEAPLDDAWLGYYTIDPTDPTRATELTKIVTRDTWGNRRPNELRAYAHVPGVVYVGQEGALSKVSVPSGSVKPIYEAEEGDDDALYTYVTALWVDPDDPQHLFFGGALNSETQVLQLYETTDEGTTVTRVTDRFGMENPEVREIVHTEGGAAVVVTDRGVGETKVLWWRG